MTREDAINLMKVIVHMLEEKYDTDRVEDAVDMAIKALEQEPCDDCVRRREVLDVLKDKWNMFSDANDAMQESINAVKTLKSVTPKQMTGHWIDGVCSECGWDAGQEAFSEDANFCMKCGVKMLPIGAEKE